MRADTLPWIMEGKDAYLRKVFKRKGEGVMAKHRASPYTPTESRGRDRWVKIKRSMSQTALTIGTDTIDGFVVGFTLGKKGTAWQNLVGSVDVAVNLVATDGTEREHIIARVSNFPQKVRQEMTWIDPETNRPTLHPDYYNRVVEIDGQDVSTKERRFRHAVIRHFRPDKTAFECVFYESDLERYII